MKYQSILLLLALCIMTCFACKDELNPQEKCVADFLAQSGMEAYTGQTWSDCRFFVHLYEYDGGHYFVMDNYCADLALDPLGCDGESLCDMENLENCDVFEGAVYIDIVGVGEL